MLGKVFIVGEADCLYYFDCQTSFSSLFFHCIYQMSYLFGHKILLSERSVFEYLPSQYCSVSVALTYSGESNLQSFLISVLLNIGLILMILNRLQEAGWDSNPDCLCGCLQVTKMVTGHVVSAVQSSSAPSKSRCAGDGLVNWFLGSPDCSGLISVVYYEELRHLAHM